MRILFIMRHSGYVRNFESTLRALCERGHTVHLAYQAVARGGWLDGATDIAAGIEASFPGRFTIGMAPGRSDAWGLAGLQLRVGLDYLRYLGPEYVHAPKLRARVERQVHPRIRAAIEKRGARMVARQLRLADRSVPTDPSIDRFIEEQRPDLLLVTPLIEPGSPQADYVRSARRRGVRTALCVASWDNLTNKGLIHDPLDLVAVWNEDMQREAVQLHGVPPDRVVVTGAQPFDHWFEWRPSTTRAEFCARLGLDAARPYLLYVCSSKFVAPEEAPFVRRWYEQLRQSDSAHLRGVGVLVRPHPQNAEQWLRFDRSGLENFAIHPPAGAPPVDVATRSEYFDSIFHSAAVVGINTTAEIEASIVGRPVLTVLAPEFEDTQEGTLHFRHLRGDGSGLVKVARDLVEHSRDLDAAIADPAAAERRCRDFVARFVRPYGREVPATPRLVDALETLGRRAATPATPPIWAPVVRRLVRPFVAQLHAEARHAETAKEAKARAQAEKVRAKQHAETQKTRARTKAAKQTAYKKMLAQRETERESTNRQARSNVASERLDWKALAQQFNTLRAPDRTRFLHEVRDAIPNRALVEVFQRGAPGRLDFPDAEILMRVSTKYERLRLRACLKEPWTTDWLRYVVQPGDVLYDIGANVGAYSLVAATKPNGGARVFAFEPSYPNLAALCENIALNRLDQQITALPIALSDQNGLDVFQLRDLSPGTAQHVLKRAAEHDDPGVFAQAVITYRLDDLINLCGMPLPNHVKLDVDGGELALLRGASRTLQSPELRSVLMEVMTTLSDEVTRHLASCGLRLHTKIDRKTKAGEDLVWYGIFVRDGVIDAHMSVANIRTSYDRLP